MKWGFPRTREKEISWKIGAIILGGALVLSPFAMLILEPKLHWSAFTVCFSMFSARNCLFDAD